MTGERGTRPLAAELLADAVRQFVTAVAAPAAVAAADARAIAMAVIEADGHPSGEERRAITEALAPWPLPAATVARRPCSCSTRPRCSRP
jgi:hypothetical protein